MRTDRLYMATVKTGDAMDNRNNAFINLTKVTKSFDALYGKFLALKEISLSIRKGQLIALTGKSGSGKTTLLNIIAGIDRPSQGRVIVAEVPLDSLKEDALAVWRGKNIGVVFQFFQLLPTLTVLENVMLPMDFCNTFPKKERKSIALSLLKKVGILEQSDKLPSALSGGQQQRAAIARALANNPPIIVADEPTGNLDSHTAEAIFELFMQLADAGKTVVVVTHEKGFYKYFRNIVTISDGVIVGREGDLL